MTTPLTDHVRYGLNAEKQGGPHGYYCYCGRTVIGERSIPLHDAGKAYCLAEYHVGHPKLCQQCISAMAKQNLNIHSLAQAVE